MSTLRDLTPTSRVAHDVALRWPEYLDQQTNAAVNLLDERLRANRGDLGAMLAAVEACRLVLLTLGIE